MKELIQKYMERISDLEKAQNVNYKTVREELASLPDYSEQLADAVARGAQGDYEKLRRKDEYITHRRVYLEKQLDDFCDETKIIPEEELNEMIETVRTSYKAGWKKHIETICKSLLAAIQADNEWAAEARRANWFIDYALHRGEGFRESLDEIEVENWHRQNHVPVGGIGLEGFISTATPVQVLLNEFRRKQREEAEG